MNKYKVLLPMLLNVILSGLTGLMLSIPYLNILWLLLYSSLFEVSIYWLINKSLKTDRTSLQISKRFKSFLNQTKWFQLLLIAYYVFVIFKGLEPELLYFYSHVLIIFYVTIYVLSISNIKMKNA